MTNIFPLRTWKQINKRRKTQILLINSLPTSNTQIPLSLQETDFSLKLLMETANLMTVWLAAVSFVTMALNSRWQLCNLVDRAGFFGFQRHPGKAGPRPTLEDFNFQPPVPSSGCLTNWRNSDRLSGSSIHLHCRSETAAKLLVPWEAKRSLIAEAWEGKQLERITGFVQKGLLLRINLKAKHFRICASVFWLDPDCNRKTCRVVSETDFAHDMQCSLLFVIAR